MADVLIVEDSPIIRMMLMQSVEAMGHTVAEAEDGRVAIERLRERRFDLVITDVVMPEADGIEVIKAIRGRHRGTRILAVSGGGPELPAEYALRLTEMFSADAILYKPFLAEELEASIARLIGRA